MRIRSNLAAGFFGAAWAALMGLAFLPLYIRYLGPEAWGVVAFCITLQAWFSLVDSGLSPAVNREFARHCAGAAEAAPTGDLLRSAELLYAAAGGACAAVLAGVAPWLAGQWLRSEALGTDAIAHGLRWLGLVIAAQWLASLYRSALLGMQLQVAPHLTTAAGATLRGLLTWYVLRDLSPTVEAFVVVQFALLAAEAAVLRLYLGKRAPLLVHGRWSTAAVLEFRGFAGGLLGIALLAVLLTQGDKLLLSALLPLEQFGFVMLAVTVAGCLGIVTAPVFNLCYPRLSELAARSLDDTAVAREYHRWAQLLAVLVLPPAAVLSFFAHDLLLLWTSDATVAASVAPLLPLWLAGSAMNSLMHIPYAAQLAHGWTRLSLAVNGAAVLLLAPLTLWLVPRHGAIAAGWIWAGVNAFYMTVAVVLMHRRILRGEAPEWYLGAVVSPAAASLLAAAGFAVWRSSQPVLSPVGLLALVAVALASTFACAVAAAPRTRRAALALAGRI